MAGLWKSARLVYRALEKEDIETLLVPLGADSESLNNAAPTLIKPQSLKEQNEFYEWLSKRLLCCVICLPVPEGEAANATTTATNPTTTTATAAPTAPKPTPIGFIVLSDPPPGQGHHRNSEIGITLHRPYYNQGYGTEAINWALRWGFNAAGLHRIGIGAYAHNAGAVRLYERMGFVPEGRDREAHFVDGTFVDVVKFGMLEHEWRERERKVQLQATPLKK